MEDQRRKCTRCLLREMAGQEQAYRTVREYIDSMEPQQRAPQDVCEARLEACRGCERLLEGMCRACGCYVEIRAAKASESCPYGMWK